MKKLLILSSAALILSSSFAIASGHGAGKKSFQKLDLNSDGVITINEAKPKMKKYFARFDLDQNGKITKFEFDSRGHKKSKYKNERRQNAKITTAYKYDSSNDNGRNSEQQKEPNFLYYENLSSS